MKQTFINTIITSLASQDDRAFARHYIDYQTQFGTIDGCLINILFQAFLPNEHNRCLRNAMGNLLPHIQNNGFVFDDSALGLPIEFIALVCPLYEYIGWDHQSYITGNTLLHHQVMSGSTEGIDYLLQQGACKDIVNNEGFTPIALLKHVSQQDSCLHYQKMLRQLG